jgi:hypothetical protein
MKTLKLSVSAALILMLCNCSNPDKGHDAVVTDSTSINKEETQKDVVPEQPMDSAAMAKACEEFMTPGEMHKMLASQSGKWDAEIVFWAGPDQPPMPPSASVVENKMIIDGRYQETVYKGTMMGMPFEGRGVTAYDNGKKIFISTWIDNSGTGLMYCEGVYDQASETVILKGKMTDPSTGKDTEIRQEIKNPDPKHQILTMYVLNGGKEFKSMEIKLTKK